MSESFSRGVENRLGVWWAFQAAIHTRTVELSDCQPSSVFGDLAQSCPSVDSKYANT